MKKFFAVLVVLAVVCTTVFAVSFNINVGAGYQYSNGKICSFSSIGLSRADFDVETFGIPENAKARFGGFHPQIGFDVEFNNHLVIYDNVGLTFVGDLDYYDPEDSNWYDFVDKEAYKSKFAITEDVGLGYAINFAQGRIVTGVGFHSEFLMFKLKTEHEEAKKQNNTITNLGISFLVKFDYQFAEHCGLFLALEPNLNLYNSYNLKQIQTGSTVVSVGDFKAHGSKIGFSGAAVAGLNFKF